MISVLILSRTAVQYRAEIRTMDEETLRIVGEIRQDIAAMKAAAVETNARILRSMEGVGERNRAEIAANLVQGRAEIKAVENRILAAVAEIRRIVEIDRRPPK